MRSAVPSGTVMKALLTPVIRGTIWRGTLTVRSEGEKTVEVARGRISASVPLIGKKIEAMVVEYLEQAHDDEGDEELDRHPDVVELPALR